PGGLPPGRLRIRAEFAAAAQRPLPELAEEVRTALFAASEQRLGLRIAEVDLRVTSLLDEPPDSPAPTAPPGRPRSGASVPDDPLAAAAASVEGVSAVTSVHGARIELATARPHRPLDVARAVRAALAGAGPGEATAGDVTIVVTAIG
ncbi:MAG TPA: hypothetical protein VIU94_04830, partial [Streptomyces sp.]